MIDFNKLSSISYRINKIIDKDTSIDECIDILKLVEDDEDYKRMLSSFALRVSESDTQQLIISLRSSIINNK